MLRSRLAGVLASSSEPSHPCQPREEPPLERVLVESAHTFTGPCASHLCPPGHVLAASRVRGPDRKLRDDGRLRNEGQDQLRTAFNLDAHANPVRCSAPS